MPPHNYGYGRQHSPEEDLTDADRFAPHNNSSSNGTLIRSNKRKQHRDARKKLSSSLNTASTDSTAANILMQRVMASRRGSLSIEDGFPDANNHLKDRTALNQHDCPTSPPNNQSQAVQETFHKYKEIYEAMLQGVFDDIDDLDCKLVHHNRSEDSSTTAEVTVEPSSQVVDEKEVNVNEGAIVVVDRRQHRDKKRDPPTTSSSASIDSADDDDAPTPPIEDRGVDPPTTTALTLTTVHDADNSMISDSYDRSKTLADLVADFHELQDIQSQDALSNDDLQSHDVMSLISSIFHHQKDDDKRRGEDLKEEDEEEGNNNKEKKEDALVLVKKKAGNMKEKENALVPVDKKKRSSSNDRGKQRKSRRPSTGKEQSNSSEDVKRSHHQGSKPSSPRKSSRSPHHGRRRTRSPSPTPPNNNNGEEKGAARVSRSKSPFDMLRSIRRSISPFGRSTQEDASSSNRYRGRSLSLSWTSKETTGDEKKSAKLFRKMKSFASSSLKILPSAGSSLHKFRVGDMAKYKISSRVRNLDGLDVFTEGDDKLCIVRILEVGEDGVLELPLYKILLPDGTKRKTNSKFLSACSKQQAKESSHRFRYEEDSRRRSRSSSNRRSSSRSSSRHRSRSRSASSSCLSSSSHHSPSNNNNRRSRSSSSRRSSSSSSSRRSPSPYEKKNSCSGTSRSKQRKNKSDGDHLTGKSSFGESEVTAKTTNKRRK